MPRHAHSGRHHDASADAVADESLAQVDEGDPTPTSQSSLPADDAKTADSGDHSANTADPRDAEIAALRAQAAQLKTDVEQARDQYLRSLAEFQNYRRRRDEESRTDRAFANRELVLQILPIVDNFERALAAAESSQSYEALIEGVKLTERQLRAFLEKNGVSAIEAVGKEFDPNLHEAVMRVEGSEQPENSVVEELQRGYVMHDRVLRPSMVKVAAR